MDEIVKLYCKDATEVFLPQGSVNLFFLNPSYWGFKMVEYGGPTDRHINNADSVPEYLDLIMKLVLHADYALAEDGSIFLMLQNRHNIVPQLAHRILAETNLDVGQLHVWDFSSTPIVKDLRYEKMGLILHLYKQKFYVNEDLHEYVLSIPLDITSLDKYRQLGFVDNNLPELLYEKFILAFSKEGDVISDIVGGTGTIIPPGLRLNRKVIYNDLSPDQHRIATARFEDTINEQH